MDFLEIVGSFLIHWDRGDYDIRGNQTDLAFLLDEFPYEGPAYRGERKGLVAPSPPVSPKPPVSWSKTLEGLIDFWSLAGIPSRPYIRLLFPDNVGYSRTIQEIPAYEAIVYGVDVEGLARWYLSQPDRDTTIDFRAERLISFKEVVTLEVPEMELIGKLVEEPAGTVVFLGL